ncbi:Uncharacterised protein [Mycobacteroides abscessus subsp. abscessus]|nr:Uncharacterised protein [Mycobacteroides abscessus subsp. abscessus]
MQRLHPCFRINKGLSIVHCSRRFSETGSNQLHFAVIGANIAGCVNARDICLHFAVDDNIIFFNFQAPLFDRAKR